MKTVIIIPTYNESESIKTTIEGLQREFKKIKGHQMHILVFDSNSTDDTQKIVKNLQKKYKNLHLQTEKEKSGLGGAYIKAMRYAMDKMAVDAVFEYDADGSHQPKYIPGMVKALEKGADVVVGSRYIPGGKMPADWGIDRKLISYFGNFIARAVLFTPQYKDMTSGFRGTKTKFLKKIDLENLLCKQFAYKIHLYYALHKLRAKIVEYPIEFIDRGKGKSKFPKNNIKDSLKVVFTLRLRESQQFLKFCVVGLVGYIINASGLAIFASLGFVEWLIWALSTEMAIISNFTLNNLWTFKAKKITGLAIIKKFLQFNLTSAGALLIQTVAGTIGTYILGPQYRQLLLPFIVVFLVLPYNYFMYTKVIWKTGRK